MMNVIAYQEDGVWIAQGIEVDIVARAETLDALEAAFSTAVQRTIIVSNHLHGSPFAGIDKAPDRFKKMFDRARSRIVPILQSNINDNDHRIDIRLASVI